MSSIISSIGGRGHDLEGNANIDQASGQLTQNATDAERNANESYQWGVRAGNDVMAMARQATGRDFTLADNATANADQLWNTYRSVYAPVGERAARDAMNFDSPEEMARVRQEAAGNANVAADTAQASRAIQLEHMGVNPNSGRFVDPTALALARTSGVADSMNRATADRNIQGIGLRQGVAQFGLGVAGLGNTSQNIALNAVQAGTTATNTGAIVASGIRTAPVAWTQASNQAASGAGSVEIGRFNAGTGAANVDEQTHHNFNVDAQNWTRIAMSDENVKEDRKAVDDERILKDLVKLPNESWKYKDGVADSGRHIGPMAQAVVARFGVKAAPKGTTIDLVTMNGLLLSGVKALAKRIEKRERAHA